MILMESEGCEMLRREIESLAEELSRRTSVWLQMKHEYEAWCAGRRAEYGDPAADDELEWEKGSSVREYHQLYIAPLEEQLAEARRNLTLFSSK